jgi:hypothetical protein
MVLQDLLVLEVPVVLGILVGPKVLWVPMDPDRLCHPRGLMVPVGLGVRLVPWVQKDQYHRLGLCRLMDH